MGPLIYIFVCIALWYAAWGIFAYFFSMPGTTYAQNFLQTTVYFLAVAILSALAFHSVLFGLLLPFQIIPIALLTVFIIFEWCLFLYMHKHVRYLPGYFEKYPMRDYLLFDSRRLISKSADILAQQIFIIVLVMSLFKLGLTVTQVSIAFFGLFALVHIPPIAREWGSWPAWCFAGAVIGFSITFPYLILKVPYGFVFTFIIHWMFYTGTALVFWYLQRKTRIV